MGLFGSIFGHAKAQFLDVIEWLEDDQQTIVYKYPAFNQAIQDSSKLVVRTGQSAIFQAEGKISGSFGPGTYELNSRTKAIWSFFESIKYGLNYPYKGDVFFISTRRFTDQKWGTPNKILLRDPDFRMVQISANGSFSYKISDSVKFLSEMVGNVGVFETKEIHSELRRRLVESFASTLGQSKIPVLDLAAQYSSLGNVLLEKMKDVFLNDYGIEILDFTIGGIVLPPEVQEKINKVSSVNALGPDMAAFGQMTAIDAMENLSKSGGGGGNPMLNAGMGLGMGGAMGNMFGNMMGNTMQQPPQQHHHQQPPPMTPNLFHYNGPSGQGQFSAQDIAQKIQANRSGSHNIWAAGWPNWKSWSQVPEIANLVPPQAAPPPVGGQGGPPPIGGNVRYHYHGVVQGEFSIDEIVAHIKSSPESKHLVWKEGFDGWKDATTVEEINQKLQSGPPPIGGISGNGGPPPPPM